MSGRGSPGAVGLDAGLPGDAAGLGPGQRAAALRWQRDWRVGGMSRHEHERARSDGEAARHAAMLVRAAASARCGAVRRCLGARAEEHLRLLLIETTSLPETARLLLPGDPDGSKTVAAQMSLLLDILAAHYAATSVAATD